jgi:hypothetical protein
VAKKLKLKHRYSQFDNLFSLRPLRKSLRPLRLKKQTKKKTDEEIID